MKTDRRLTIIEKIESRCDIVDTGFKINNKASPCHLWTGPTSGSGRGGGYGRMCLDGQTVATHIVAYTHYFGYIPGKKQVDHLCNQRLCCNPQHLELVTHLRNQRRRAKRAKGKNNGILTPPTSGIGEQSRSVERADDRGTERTD